MVFWYLRISRSATVPGRKRCGFFRELPLAGADLRATLLASCFRGALPPVDLRAVCFVRAMLVLVLRIKDTEIKKAVLGQRRGTPTSACSLVAGR